MTTLGEHIPPSGLTPDATLEALLSWIADRGLEPYEAQEEAILELWGGRHVILATPTGSGKSLVATALHALHLATGRRSVYTAPIKALVAEKFFALCQIFGADRVGMMTGDGSVNRDAPIVCCTAEILAKIALRQGADTPYDAVIMDEFHYYGDRDRGMAWQVPLLTMPDAQFLLMSATLGPTDEVEDSLTELTGEEVAVVRGSERPVPLEFSYRKDKSLDVLQKLVAANKKPVYAVHFSQRSATELAQSLLSTNFLDDDAKDAIKKELKGFRFDSPFGKHIRRMVRHGIGLHHAGLLPKYRLLVEKLAQQGRFVIICGTDTLGVGINVPIRTVLFTQLCKYDGVDVDILTVRDFQQIAGRAGRKGYDDTGYVVAVCPEWIAENKRLEAQIASGKKSSKKVRKAQPPTRGYKHWDEQTFEQLIEGQPEALEPVFTMDHGVVLARLQRAADRGTDPMVEIDTLIEASHTGRNETERLQAEARERISELVQAGIIEPVNSEDFVHYEVYEDLQEDFSLYHALSLFLLHLLSHLDPEDKDYPLDVITMVEAILEHPRVVLYAQESREKGRVIAELKADGVPYEERIEALETVTYPKPHAQFLYDTFEDWREARPWLAGDPIRPKSVVRELVETRTTFSAYVKGLKINRSEGVLLRYISQVYRTLVTNVPESYRTDALVDALAYLRALLARVDDSLVTTWEALVSPEEESAEVEEQPVDISADEKSFRARIRAELHNVVRALAHEDWDEAEATVRQVEGFEFDGKRFRKDTRAFRREHGGIAWDGRVRQAWHTVIREDGDHLWRVSQRLLPADLEVDPDEVPFFVNGVVDLTEDRNPSGPLVQVVSVEEA